ncbi:hypothetical protein Ccrd_003140 [Cynara cardunculus var. scolymus]|uniref:Wall-associated receptor kinase galacturonan-binding domain-containing protein n=1 Tax=Cynara cardunculus var. scolymus TaxID=59895 RepID=A0A103XQ04_CYNCS|nr:hypothetical protein Ccrd_003140 [Cynara cardunculus var. scolymus]
MKTLVLMWALLLMFSFTASETYTPRLPQPMQRCNCPQPFCHRQTPTVSSICYLPNGKVSIGLRTSLGLCRLALHLLGSCMTICSTLDDVVADGCTGSGCCQSSIPHDINYYTTRLDTLRDPGNISYTRSFNPCTYAFVGEENSFNFSGITDLNDTSLKEKIEANVSIVLEWGIGNLSCIDARKIDGFACQSNSECTSMSATIKVTSAAMVIALILKGVTTVHVYQDTLVMQQHQRAVNLLLKTSNSQLYYSL